MQRDEGEEGEGVELPDSKVDFVPEFYTVIHSLCTHAVTRGTYAVPGSHLRYWELLGSEAKILVEGGIGVLAEARPHSGLLGNAANAEFTVCLTLFQQWMSLC